MQETKPYTVICAFDGWDYAVEILVPESATYNDIGNRGMKLAYTAYLEEFHRDRTWAKICIKDMKTSGLSETLEITGGMVSFHILGHNKVCEGPGRYVRGNKVTNCKGDLKCTMTSTP